MMEKLVLRRGVFFEGTPLGLRAIYPTPVISPAMCDFIDSRTVLFREDNFDPVTRIRRGRLYIEEQRGERYPNERVDPGIFRSQQADGPYGLDWISEVTYKAWEIRDSNPKNVFGNSIQIGSNGYITPWRIITAERIAIGHILLTLRAYSLFGVIPELSKPITDKDGNEIDIKPVQESLDSLVDAFHRQQGKSTVDVARETTRVIISTWIGPQAHKKDLADTIKLIPTDKLIAGCSASIINRLHSRAKSSVQEEQDAKGSPLRSVIEEDSECAINLVGILLREIGWASNMINRNSRDISY